MIIDAHCHLGSKHGHEVTVEALLSDLDRAGVDKAVVFGRIANFREEFNDFIAECVATHPDRLIGFAVVNPRRENGAEELRRAVTDLGMKGLKLHPTWHSYHIDDHELMDPIFRTCDQFGIPVLIHGVMDSHFLFPHQFGVIAARYPGLTIVWEHMGEFQNVDLAMRIAGSHANIHFGTSMTFTSTITRAYGVVGAERILMGTDWPFQDQRAEICKVKVAVEDEEAQRRILGENAVRLLGIG